MCLQKLFLNLLTTLTCKSFLFELYYNHKNKASKNKTETRNILKTRHYDYVHPGQKIPNNNEGAFGKGNFLRCKKLPLPHLPPRRRIRFPLESAGSSGSALTGQDPLVLSCQHIAMQYHKVKN